ncbi:aminoglycoside phosphotransferase family protein [Formosa sediminum]|uniref:Aminoglycoside phosphotransferase family protein n=1 Tax=Formosa sediminum TaxID=2594004 RepID=A0A516GUL7_9FLAO|nr:aminoglycoside phosphotransferase family protein [Formosa sediminum]QDO95208.1 aminoglycoside phosphotransferase family protein [Formosa sediminum]
MNKNKIENIFNQFEHLSNYRSSKELVSGHINDSYLITTHTDKAFVLQRINHEVFKDVPGLISNKVAISNHLKSKFQNLNKSDLHRRVLTFIPTSSGVSYYIDEKGNYWNLSIFIANSFTHNVVESEVVAYEGGKLFGEFLNLTGDFDTQQLIEVIPNFHDMSFRYKQFKEALNLATNERKAIAEDCINKVEMMKDEMHILQNLKTSGAIRLRVTHNDTKISNALFDKENKGLCVIDTDTVMPGIIHYDFGDAIRTICNTAAEDEKDLNLVSFNKTYYEAYKKGFLETINNALTPTESKYLPLGAKTMIFIMALRFLTDYLNNDIYYKTKYPNHNLDRAKNQFKLIESFDEQMHLELCLQ